MCLLSLQMLGCASEYQVIDPDSGYLSQLHQDSTYVIGCGDKLRIQVWGHEDLTEDVVVRPDGKISFPLIGDIQAQGLRIEDLKQILNEKMSEYIQEPSLSVTVLELASMKVYILGEVNQPGEYELDTYTDVLQAVAKAGGFTIYAKKNDIQILRTKGNEKIKIKFNYKQVVQGRNLQQNIPLKPGDVIIVP